mmetsp:Transcript_23122/g.39118  ORF Transcript_23122/g.39118 Transcript_23122/m.39118 type:complete len:220 (-) Transcript_23122:969-1628(-)
MPLPHHLERGLGVGHPALVVEERHHLAVHLELSAEAHVVVVVHRELHGQLFVLGQARAAQLLAQARGLQQRLPHPRGHGVSLHREHGRPRPQAVQGRRVRVPAERGVQEELGELSPPEVLVARACVAEHELVRCHAPLPRLTAQVFLRVLVARVLAARAFRGGGGGRRGEAKEPEQRVGDALEDGAPHVQDLRGDLPQLAEVAEHELVFRQAVQGARGR